MTIIFDTQHNGTQHNATQHNDTEHNGTEHNDTDLLNIMTLSTMTISTDIRSNYILYNDKAQTSGKMTIIKDTQHYDIQHKTHMMMTLSKAVRHNDT